MIGCVRSRRNSYGNSVGVLDFKANFSSGSIRCADRPLSKGVRRGYHLVACAIDVENLLLDSWRRSPSRWLWPNNLWRNNRRASRDFNPVQAVEQICGNESLEVGLADKISTPVETYCVGRQCGAASVPKDPGYPSVCVVLARIPIATI